MFYKTPVTLLRKERIRDGGEEKTAGVGRGRTAAHKAGKKAVKAEMETYLAMTDEEEEGENTPGKLPAGD